jgi:glycosyltransferase involved in cell wall biosynthesis
MGDDDWGFLGPSLAVLSPFPPDPDGIARYAEQLVQHLVPHRDVLRVGLTGRGGGDVHVNPHRFPGLLWALPTTRGRHVLIQWHAPYYVLGRLPGRLLRWASLAIFLRVRSCVVVFHEADDERHRTTRGIKHLGLRVEEGLRRRCWQAPFTPVFHTTWERDRFGLRFPRPGRRRPAHLVAHGSWFELETAADRVIARQQLDLPPDSKLFLCIGFLRERKGFDRAIRAFGRAAPDAELYIVGSQIRDDVSSDEHIARLRRLAQRTPRVHLMEEYVDDTTFDLWLKAADVLVLPYREAASSGVVVRAQKAGVTVVGSDAGGLPEQLLDSDVLIATDDELETAFAHLGAADSV